MTCNLRHKSCIYRRYFHKLYINIDSVQKTNFNQAISHHISFIAFRKHTIFTHSFDVRQKSIDQILTSTTKRIHTSFSKTVNVELEPFRDDFSKTCPCVIFVDKNRFRALIRTKYRKNDSNVRFENSVCDCGSWVF